MKASIAVVLVCGFRGAGKSSVIRHLARGRNVDDTWGVIGPADAVCSAAGLLHEAVPHGCPCCVGSVSFRTGMVRLLRHAGASNITQVMVEGGPDGHANTTRAAIASGSTGALLQVTQVIAVLDPRWVELPLPAARSALEALVRDADTVLANKWDSAGMETRAIFSSWMRSLGRSWVATCHGTPVNDSQAG